MMEIYTVFIGSLSDGMKRPWVYYDNPKAAKAHRDHINEAIAKSNPLGVSDSFVRTVCVRSVFGGAA